MNSFSLENKTEMFVRYQPYIYRRCVWISFLSDLLIYLHNKIIKGDEIHEMTQMACHVFFLLFEWLRMHSVLASIKCSNCV